MRIGKKRYLTMGVRYDGFENHGKRGGDQFSKNRRLYYKRSCFLNITIFSFWFVAVVIGIFHDNRRGTHQFFTQEIVCVFFSKKKSFEKLVSHWKTTCLLIHRPSSGVDYSQKVFDTNENILNKCLSWLLVSGQSSPGSWVELQESKWVPGIGRNLEVVKCVQLDGG